MATQDQKADRAEDHLHRVFLGMQDGKWHAISMDFTIVGQGDSPSAALERMNELLDDYFKVCSREGRSFSELRRPLSLRWRLQLYARVVLGHLLHVVRRAPTPPSVRLTMPGHRVANC